MTNDDKRPAARHKKPKTVAEWIDLPIWRFLPVQTLLLIAVAAVIALVSQVFSNSNEKLDTNTKVWLLIGMVVFAVSYNFLRRLIWFKIGFGVLQAAGGLWANWFQLSKLQTTSLQNGKIDRLIFVCAGIALLAKGVKEIDEGIADQIKRKKRERSTPQSSESSEAPIPGSQAPE